MVSISYSIIFLEIMPTSCLRRSLKQAKVPNPFDMSLSVAFPASQLPCHLAYSGPYQLPSWGAASAAFPGSVLCRQSAMYCKPSCPPTSRLQHWSCPSPLSKKPGTRTPEKHASSSFHRNLDHPLSRSPSRYVVDERQAALERGMALLSWQPSAELLGRILRQK